VNSKLLSVSSGQASSACSLQIGALNPIGPALSARGAGFFIASRFATVRCLPEGWSLPMLKPLLDPDVADLAPTSSVLTGYDEEPLLTYIRLLDARGRGLARGRQDVLHIDPEKEPEGAFRAWETHLARARWMTTHGYKYLLAGGAPH
jgi:hypothetical protein